MNGVLYYIHDPMCSWCYAFERSLVLLKDHLPETIRIKKLVGGLAPDSSAVMPLPLQQSIQATWCRIEQKVPHVRFNHDFWRLNTPIRSTYPACRAVLAALRQGKQFEDRMIHAIQDAYYQQAQNPALPPVLIECARSAGLDIEQFAADVQSTNINKELQEHIGLARKIGATTFPSLCLHIHDQLTAIPVDYLGYEPMLDQIRLVSAG